VSWNLSPLSGLMLVGSETHGFAVGYILTPLRGWELTPSVRSPG